MSSVKTYILSITRLCSRYHMLRILSSTTKLLKNQTGNIYSRSWILGILLTILLPLLTKKWRMLLKYKNEVDNAVETIEKIAVVVEKAAKVVEKVAEGISDDLPEGSELKKLIDRVEDLAEETTKDAHQIEDAIDKVVEGKVKIVVQNLNEHP